MANNRYYPSQPVARRGTCQTWFVRGLWRPGRLVTHEPDEVPALPLPDTTLLESIREWALGCLLPRLGRKPGLQPRNVASLEVEYQVLLNGRPLSGNNALSRNGVSVITESITNATFPVTGAGAWCLVTAKCKNPGSLYAIGTFWDALAGNGTANQSSAERQPDSRGQLPKFHGVREHLQQRKPINFGRRWGRGWKLENLAVRQG